MKSRTRVRVAAVVTCALAGTTVTVSAMNAAHASTEPVAAALPAPSVVGPDDSGLGYPRPVRKAVKLDWAPVSGATGYRVQVGTDETWSSDVDYSKDVFYSEATLPLWLPNATYVWRVAALKGSAVGHWSSEAGQAHSDATFTLGWREKPTPDPVTVPFGGSPTFSWSPVPEASGYELQVSTAPFGFAPTTAPSPDTSPTAGTQTQAPVEPDPLIADCMTPRTRVTPFLDVVGKSGSVGPCTFNFPDAGTTVFWRVRALDAYVGEGTTISTTPGASEGVSYQPPSNPDKPRDLTSVCPEDPETDASASPSPSASPSDKPLNLECKPIRPSQVGPWADGGSFAWTYATPGGIPGLYAPTVSLASDPEGLCTVTNPGAAQAEHAVCRDVPTIRWSEVQNVGRYRVIIALDDAFTNIQHEVETSGLQWTPPGSWRDSPAGTTYYYAVQACDASFCGPVTPAPPSFSKMTPRPTVGTAPGSSGEIHLSWQAYADSLSAATGQDESQDAYAYHVQVAKADNPTYDTLVDDVVVDGTSYTPLTSYGDGAFVWRVQPLDSLGNRLPFSLSQSFSRDATPPKALSVVPGSGVGVLPALKVTFSEPVTGVSASSLTLSPAAPATVSVTSPTTAVIRPTRALAPGATYRVMLTSAIKDSVGNAAVATGPAVTVSPRADNPSKAITYSGTWRHLSSSNAVGGTFHSSTPTSTAKTSASMRFGGVGLTLYACMGPSNGYLEVYVDGVRKTRVSTYRSYTGCGVKVAAIGGLARTLHTVKVVGVGARVSASNGTSVSVDALVVSP